MATSPSYTKVHHEVSLDGTLDLEEAPMQEISLQKTSYAQMDEGDTLLIAADDLVSHSADGPASESFMSACCAMLCGGGSDQDAKTVLASSTDKKFIFDAETGTISKQLVDVTEGCYPPGEEPIPEDEFYTQCLSPDHELSAFVPEFHGTNDVGGISYIMLEDLTRGYTHPCVLDLKLGKSAYALHAIEDKVASEESALEGTTMQTHGLLLNGIRVWNKTESKYIQHDSTWGKAISGTELRGAIGKYFKTDGGPRTDVLDRIQADIKRLLAHFNSQTDFRFYGSSLFLVYEGDSAPHEHSSGVKAKAKMIDFDHVFKSEDGSKDKDEGVYEGLAAFQKELTLLQQELMQEAAKASFDTKLTAKWANSPKSRRRSAHATPDRMEDLM